MVVGPIEVSGTAFVDVARWDKEQEVNYKYAPGKRGGLSRRDFELFGCIARTLSNPNNLHLTMSDLRPFAGGGPEKVAGFQCTCGDVGRPQLAVRSLRQADSDGRWSALTGTGTDNNLGVEVPVPVRGPVGRRERLTKNPPNAQRLRRWPKLTQRE